MHPDDATRDPAHHTPGGIDVPTLALVGVVSVVIIAVIFLCAEALLYKMEDHERRAGWVQPNSHVAEYRARENKILNTLGTREDDGKKALVIPIDQAMELLAQHGLQSAQK